MVVREDWQGRGVGTALMRAAIDLAERWLQLRRLELTVYPDNEPAIRLYRKFGFVEEGRMRGYAFRDGGYAFRDGAYADAILMARLRPDHA